MSGVIVSNGIAWVSSVWSPTWRAPPGAVLVDKGPKGDKYYIGRLCLPEEKTGVVVSYVVIIQEGVEATCVGYCQEVPQDPVLIYDVPFGQSFSVLTLAPGSTYAWLEPKHLGNPGYIYPLLSERHKEYFVKSTNSIAAGFVKINRKPGATDPPLCVVVQADGEDTKIAPQEFQHKVKVLSIGTSGDAATNALLDADVEVHTLIYRCDKELDDVLPKLAAAVGSTGLLPPGLDFAADIGASLLLVKKVLDIYGFSEEKMGNAACEVIFKKCQAKVTAVLRDKAMKKIKEKFGEKIKNFIAQNLSEKLAAKLLSEAAKKAPQKGLQKFLPGIGQAIAAAQGTVAAYMLAKDIAEQCKQLLYDNGRETMRVMMADFQSDPANGQLGAVQPAVEQFRPINIVERGKRAEEVGQIRDFFNFFSYPNGRPTPVTMGTKTEHKTYREFKKDTSILQAAMCLSGTVDVPLKAGAELVGIEFHTWGDGSGAHVTDVQIGGGVLRVGVEASRGRGMFAGVTAYFDR